MLIQRLYDRERSIVARVVMYFVQGKLIETTVKNFFTEKMSLSFNSYFIKN